MKRAVETQIKACSKPAQPYSVHIKITLNAYHIYYYTLLVSVGQIYRIAIGFILDNDIVYIDAVGPWAAHSGAWGGRLRRERHRRCMYIYIYISIYSDCLLPIASYLHMYIYIHLDILLVWAHA